MTYQIVEHDFGGGAVQAYFYRSGAAAAFAVDKSLPPSHKRSRQIEGLANFIRPSKSNERVCFRVVSAERVDPLSVSAISRLVEDLEPEWVSRVREACRESNVLEEIAGECNLEMNAVAAIVGRLVARGELPPLGSGEAGEPLES